MQNKIRKQNRYAGHDYSLPGFYFVTICTDEMKEYFGNVKYGEMRLNQLGKIAENFWVEIPKHFQDISLDKFVVMPNHVHGIFQIVVAAYTRPENLQSGKSEAAYMRPLRRDKALLSKILQGYKAAVIREIKRKFNTGFQWQRSYYDRFIRNDVELAKIAEYIERNPKFWEEEKNEVENIFY